MNEDEAAALVAQLDQATSTSKDMGKMIGAMYSSMVESGIPQSHALILTERWMIITFTPRP